MTNKTIVLAGGSGFIGQELCNHLGKNNRLIVLGRQLPNQQSNSYGEDHLDPRIAKRIQFLKWDGKTLGDWVKALDHADVLINLTGKSVNCRYTQKNMQEIFDSRTNANRVLGEAIRSVQHPPQLWINAASATIYPNATDTPRDESFTGFADDFSVQVCKRWEKTFYEEATPFTRKVALRMAITLGEGGVMVPYFNLLKFGLGGRQGDGKQMYSWIHITDTCRMIGWIADNAQLTGTYNCCSPDPVTNHQFMKTLRDETRQRFGLPAFKWLLKIGALIIGTETELIFKSRWVIPTRIKATGFTFQYGLLSDALHDIISKTPQQHYRLFGSKLPRL